MTSNKDFLGGSLISSSGLLPGALIPLLEDDSANGLLDLIEGMGGRRTAPASSDLTYGIESSPGDALRLNEFYAEGRGGAEERRLFSPTDYSVPQTSSAVDPLTGFGEGFQLGGRSEKFQWDQSSLETSQSGLLIHLNLDEPGGKIAKDSAPLGGNNKGFLKHGASFVSLDESVLGGGVRFDGINDLIAIKGQPKTSLQAKRTVAVWFKADDPTKGKKQVIYEEGGPQGGLNIYLDEGRLYAGGWDRKHANWSGTFLSTNQVEANQWHHVVLVLDADPGKHPQAGAFSAYLDGQQFGEGVGTALRFHHDGIGIGRAYQSTRFHDKKGFGGGNRGLAGVIADVRVYDRALSGAEINDLCDWVLSENDPPIIEARLANDTAPVGTNEDRLTYDPTIRGQVRDSSPIKEFKAAIGDQPLSDYVDISTYLQPDGSFELNRAVLEDMNGGTLPDGPYTIHFIATDIFGNHSYHKENPHSFNGFADLEAEVFQLPAGEGETVKARFSWVERDAGFNNELGLFIVDDAEGRIGDLKPGDRGYAAAALSHPSRQIIFKSGLGEGAVQELDLPAGRYVGYYIVQNDTTERFLEKNPKNQLKQKPKAFFSFQAANPDGFDHMQVDPSEPNLFRFEDLTNGGDKDFTDVVVKVELDLPAEPVIDALSFVLDTTVAVPSFDLLPASDSDPLGDQKTTLETVTLTGTTEPFAQVSLSPGGKTVTADENGAFTFFELNLALGLNEFSAEAVDAAGNRSSFERTFERLPIFQPPDISAPEALTTPEDNELQISGITFADPDAGATDLWVKISVGQGQLNLTDTSGLQVAPGTGSNNSVLEFTGTLAAINQAIATLSYQPKLNFNGTDRLEIWVNDQSGANGEGLTATQSVALVVTPVNDAPVLTVPVGQSVGEDETLTLPAIQVSDVDAGDGVLEVRLAVDQGTVSLAALEGLTFTAGSGTGDRQLVFQGTLVALNQALGAVVYTPGENYAGGDVLNIQVNDLGNQGEGSVGEASAAVDITVVAQNDAPILSGPENLSVDEASPLEIPVSISDIDAEEGEIRVEVTVEQGELSLPTTTGVVLAPESTATALVLTGTLPSLNTALAGLTYLSPVNFEGLARVEVVVDDQGNTGTGGPLSDRLILEIQVRSINIAPEVGPDTVLMVQEDSGVNDLGIPLPQDRDGDSLSVILEELPTQGVIQKADGTVVGLGDALGVSDLPGLQFVPEANAFGSAGRFRYTVEDGQGGIASQSITIEISPVNDAPVITAPSVLETNRNQPLSIPNLGVADIDAGNNPIQVRLSAPGGTLSIDTSFVTVEGDANSASLTLTGPLIAMNQALASLSYQSRPDLVGNDILTIVVSDLGQTGSGGEQIVEDTIEIVVMGANTPPTVEANKTLTVLEDSPATPLAIAPPQDLDGDELSLRILSVPDIQRGAVWLNGSPLALDQALTIEDLTQLTFVPVANANGSAGIFAYEVRDGQGGIAQQQITLEITPVNDAPQWTVPGFQSADPETETVIRGVQLTDIDAGENEIQVTVSAVNGILHLPQRDGLSFESGTGEASPTLVFTGNLAAINQSLASLTYRSNPGFSETDTLTLIANDLGNSGEGGAQTQTATLSVVVEEITGVTLVEEQFFEVVYEESVVIPVEPSRLVVRFANLNFDPTDPDFINDAFEVALVDESGRSLVQTVGSGKDAFFNVTEDELPQLAPGVTQDNQTVQVDVSGIEPGTNARLIFRLVNNDDDTETTVLIRDFTFVAEPGLGNGSAVPSVDFRRSDREINFRQLGSVANSAQVNYFATSFNQETQVLSTDISLENIGNEGWSGPLVLVIRGLSDPAVQVANADGFTPEGFPYFDITDQLEAEKLNPGEMSAARTITFLNPTGEQFTYEVEILAQGNQVPVIESEPGLEVIGGLPYRYDVNAVDPDLDPLTYALQVAPEGMVIDAVTGQIEWQTTTDNIASHRVTVVVNDGRGGLTEQSYTLNVIAPPPNRPPLFTSIPVVDAQINQPYQYDADAIDPDQDALIYSVIRGPEGFQIDPITGQVDWTPGPTLAIGDTVLSQISLPGDREEFVFSGAVGQKLYLDLLREFNGLSIQIFAPSGKLVNVRDGLFTLTENGNYTVVVDGNGAQTGQYGFSLIDPSLLPEADLDQAVVDRLSPGTDDDLFRFTGFTGQKIFLDQLSNSGFFANWVLFGTGNQIVAQDFSMNDLELYLPTDGEYILAVRGRGTFGELLEYSLEIVTPDETSAPMILGSNLDPQVISGTISEPGEEDFYTFAGVVGQRVYLDRLNTINDGNIRVRLFGPSDRQYFDRAFWLDTEAGPVTLLEEGEYRIQIDGNGDRVGDYAFSLRDLGLATPAELDTTYSGTLSLDDASSHLYQFQANEGQRIFIDSQSTGAVWFSTTVAVYDSGNREVARNSAGQAIEWVIDKTDTYTLAISNRDQQSIDYSFTLVTPEISSQPLAFNTPTFGEIREKGEQDRFTFEANQGQQILLDILQSSNHRVSLISPSGQELVSAVEARDEGGFNLNFVYLPEAGTYEVFLDGFGGGTGSYGFQILDVSNAEPIVPGTVVNASLDPGRAIRVYQFDGNEGDRVYLDRQDGSNFVYTRLWGPDSNLLADTTNSFNGNSDREVVLGATGTYFVAIQGEENTPVEFSLQLVISQDSSSTINLDETVSGSISVAGEQDTYQFVGSQGQTLVLDALQGTTSFSFSVKNSSGNFISQGNLGNSSSALWLPEDGVYALTVDGFDATTGNYQFAVRSQSLDVQVGDRLSDTLSAKETRLYTFEGVEGTTLSLSSLVGSNTGRWTLYAPDGSQILAAALNQSSSTPLQMNGEYLLTVQNDAETETTYQLEILDISPALVPSLGLNQVYEGSLPVRESTTISLAANAGQLIYLDGLFSSGTRVDLTDPDGQRVGGLSGFGSGSDLVLLTKTGDYSLRVESFFSSDPVTYQIQVLDLESVASDMALNTPIAQALETNETKVFQFSGTLGQRIFLDGLDTSDVGVTARLIDAFGREIASSNSSANFGIQTLRYTGTHYLLIDSANSQPTTAQFRLLDVDDVAIATTVDTLITGDFGVSQRETNFYAFNGQAGQKLYIDRFVGGTNIGNRSGNKYALYTPDGQRILTEDLIRDGELTLPSTGQYVLELSGNGDSNNDYEIQLVTPEDLTETISLNTVINGAISEAGQTNTYRFVGAENQQILLDALSALNSQFQLLATLYSPSGKQIANLDFANDNGSFNQDPGLITLHENGLYELVIDAAGEFNSTYSFQILDVAASDLVALDTTLAGSFALSNEEAQVYRFNGLADQRVYFDLKQGSISDRYALYSPAGNELFSQLLDRDFDIVLPATGEYVLTILGRGGSVDYNIDLVTPDYVLEDYVIGETLQSSIDEPGEVDFYRFRGDPGQIISLDGLYSSNSGIYIALRAPTTVEAYEEARILGQEFFFGNEPQKPLVVVLDESGEFIVEVNPRGDQTSSYQFRILDFAAAQSIAIGETISSSFGVEGFDDSVYRFSVLDQTRLFVDGTVDPVTGFSSGYYLYDSSGNLLSEGSLGDIDLSETVLDAGDYYLLIRGQGSPNGSYTFKLLTPEWQTQAYELGTSVFSTFGVPGEQDWYTFEGEVGQKIYIDQLVGTSPYLIPSLVSPSGQVVTGFADGFTRDKSEIYTLEESGTYTFKFDARFDVTGDYGFRILDLNQADSLAFETPLPANFGTSNRETQIYKVSVEAGDRYLLNSTGGFDVRLFDADGNAVDLIGTTSFSGVRRIQWDEGGDYYVVLGGQGDSSIDASLTISDISVPPNALELGTKQTGDIGQNGEVQVYRFEAIADQRVFLNVLSGLDQFSFQLLSPSGRQVYTAQTSPVPLRLDESGTYSLVIDGTSFSFGSVREFQLGEFSFQLTNLSEEASPLSLGGANTGTLNPGEANQFFTFTGQKGSILSFDLAAVQWLDANWVLFDPGDRAIVSPAQDNPDFQVVLPSSGVYTLAILNSADLPTSYAFQVTDITPPPVTAQGLNTLYSGNFAGGDPEIYTISASAGTRVIFDGQTTAFNSVQVRLRNPDGTLLLDNQSPRNDSQPLLLQQTGDYTLEVYGGAGDYAFQILDFPSNLRSPGVNYLEIGGTTAGTLSALSSKVYTFEGLAGLPVYFNGITGANIRAQLVAPNGEELLNSVNLGNFDAGPFDLTQDGTYHFVISNDAADARDYNFQLLELSSGTSLDFGIPVQGSLASGQEVTYYKLQAEAGQTLFFDINNDAGTWALYDPFNERIHSDVRNYSFNRDFEVTLEYSGDYLLVLGGGVPEPYSYEFSVFGYDPIPAEIVTPGLGGGASGEASLVAEYAVELSVEDPQGASDIQVYTIQVGPDPNNNNPTILSDPKTVFGLNEDVYRYQIAAIDPDQDVLRYRLVNGPLGSFVDSNSGELLWFPEDGVVPGTSVDFVVQTYDGRGGFDTQEFQVEVFNRLGKVQGIVFDDLNGNGILDTKFFKGDNPSLVLALDVSGSTQAPFRGSQAYPEIKTVLDAQVAASFTLLDALIGQGLGNKVNIGLIPHNDLTVLQDMDPVTPGLQPYTTALADQDNNGIPDIREILEVYEPSGSNNFTRTLESIRSLTEVLPGDPNVIFMSDGYDTSFLRNPEEGIRVVEALNEAGVNLSAFAIGEASTLSTLEKIDPNAEQIVEIEPLIKVFAGVDPRYAIEPLKEDIGVYLDLNNNGVLDTNEPFQVTQLDEAGRPVDGATYLFSFEDLTPETYTVRPVIPSGLIQTAPEISPSIAPITLDGEYFTYYFGLAGQRSPENLNPIFQTNFESRAISAGETVIYRPRATDPDGDRLRYDLFLPPEGMTVDTETGIVTWIPTQAQVEQYYADLEATRERLGPARSASVPEQVSFKTLLRVSDGRGGQALQELDLTLLPINSAASFTSILVNNQAQVGKEFRYQSLAIDPEGDPVIYSLAPGAPTGLTIDSSSGLLTWTPSAQQLGQYDVGLLVTDDKGAQSRQVLSLSVIEAQPNQAPVITSQPRVATRVNTPYLYQIKVQDLDGDAIAYEIVEGPESLTIDASGLVSWEPNRNQIGTYPISITVNDGQGGVDTQTYTLDVRNQVVNFAPEITSEAPLLTNVARPYQYQALATDPDGDVLFWELRKAPEGMIIDLASGVVSWQPSFIQVGSHRVEINVLDAYGASASQTYTLEVRGTNTPPRITSVPPTQIGINQPYRYQVEAKDPEGDRLKYRLGKHPAGMSLDENTGELLWTPNTGQLGSHVVELLVQDTQGGVGQQTYTLVVTQAAVNQAPAITSTPGFWADVANGYQYQITAIDPNNDPLTYSLVNGPTGMTVDETSGLLTWQPIQVGSVQVTVAAYDPLGAGSIQNYTLQVTEVNQAPVIRSVPIGTATSETTYRYDVLASDPDREAIAYSLVNAPEGMVIDNRGRITWATNSNDIGTYPIEIQVRDGRGAIASQRYDLVVQNDIIAPRVTINVNQSRVNVGDRVTVKVSATDNIGVESLALTVGGEAIALDAQGIATLDLNTIGNIELVASAIDAAGNVGTQNQAVQVIDPTDTTFPVVNLISYVGDIPLETGITAPTGIVGSVQDTDLLSYTLAIAPLEGGEFVEIARGSGVVDNGLLGTLDPTLLQNDSYLLRLAATDLGGRTSSIDAIVNIEGDLKLGNFRLSFTDLSIPVTGIPIQVTRTYDSLTANETDDFGYGWRMEFRNVNLRTGIGKDELLEFIDVPSKGFREGDKVFITLPGGEREVFTFKPKKISVFDVISGIDVSTPFYQPVFESEKDSTNTLSVKTNGVSLRPNAQGEYYSPSGYRYNPAADLVGFGGYYDLTTKEGIVYRINARTGDLDTITDRNGNVLTFSDRSITSSTGVEVLFERDAQGRVTAVIDPEGNRIRYEYDALGDLVAVSDREGNTTRFDYNDDRLHYLDEIIDPLGRSGIRTEYDEQGRLVRMIDADGNPVELIYDPDNDIQQVSDQLGNITTYEYDERGNVLREVDSLGGVTIRTYDDRNNMLTEADPLGNTMTFTYDGDRNVLTETDALGNVTRYTYNRFGNILTTTDPTGQTISNTYDRNGNLTKIEGQASGLLTFEYDEVGNLIQMEDASGITTFAYDSVGNLISQVDAVGTSTNYFYDPRNNNLIAERTVQTLPDGTLRSLATKMVYDRENRLIKTIDADGNITETIYDAAGNRVEEIDALGRSTRYIYDDRGQMVATIYPDATPDIDADNPRTQTVYDAKGQVISEIDELGRVTRMVYDALGRQVEMIYPDATPDTDADNPRMQMEYDAAGRKLADIDPRGNRTEYRYDDAGRLIETILPDETPEDLTDNPRFTTAYDAAGRQLTQTDALGQVIRFIYDDLGRPIAQEYDDGTRTATEFDDAGRVVARIDQAGVVTRYEYDALGRLTAVVDALNQRTVYTYDEQGNLITQTDANGNTTRYEYDRLGRRIATVLPLGERETYEYDAVGNQIRRIDFNGEVTEYSYDERNRLIVKDLPGEEYDETHSYTDNGLRETVVDNRGTATYRYDEQNRLIEREDPDGRKIAYSYDIAGNRTSVEIPSGTTAYTFDAQNRLKTVTDPEGGVTTYFYNGVGNLERTTFPNGTEEIREYDELNRLVFIQTTGPEGVIASFRYTLDATGNRLAVDEHDGRRVEYSYDLLYRLTKETIFDPGATEASRTIEYVYDPVGNRLSRVDSGEGTTIYTYDDNDRLLRATLDGVVTSYTYDNNGNTMSKTTDGTTITYAWNADNRLVGADTDGDGAIDVVNEYNEDGIRVGQIVNGEVTRFLIDANRSYAQVLEEYSTDEIIKVFYIYGNDLISQNRGGDKSIYHVDGLGSTRAISDVVGDNINEYNFDAFGQISYILESEENRYRYSGEQFIPELDLSYNRARHYNQDIGRFISRDQWLGDSLKPITLNKYLYGSANPVRYIDPSGYFSISSTIAAMSIIIILADIALSEPITHASSNSRTNGVPAFHKMSGHYLTGLPEEVYKELGGRILYNHEHWPDAFNNTCALRVSRALNYSDAPIPFIPRETISGSDKLWYIFRVKDMEKYLTKKYGAPEIVSEGTAILKFLGKKGIIIFDTQGAWSDATGHVDLWNGASCIGKCYFREAKSVKLWTGES
ncbi:T6SS effector amidase Tae4 family protein [Lyngbya confervoides]|uniref:T6SS effector amidase Tae4 family protein n=1 Tax=Lyngbya confervoides BDU141951 TaxID=1574623 RepID=A0ABD4T032_9CYAN|nr:T6SS effector amidase Tae4 family protein [Lyngbya confervoides]MCM1981745.1 T6SS effector amidase Tae4 family protein [Lyngbya confervoides BDU141951]